MICDWPRYQIPSSKGRSREATAITTIRSTSPSTEIPTNLAANEPVDRSTVGSRTEAALGTVATLRRGRTPSAGGSVEFWRRWGDAARGSGRGDEPAEVPQLLGLGAQRELELLEPLEVPVDRVVEVDADAAVHVERSMAHPAAALRRPELRGGDLHARVLARGELRRGLEHRELDRLRVDVGVG